MTTVQSANVHNIALEGTFDDRQDLVKALFAHEAFRDRYNLSAVNSINWPELWHRSYIISGPLLIWGRLTAK